MNKPEPPAPQEALQCKNFTVYATSLCTLVQNFTERVNV